MSEWVHHDGKSRPVGLVRVKFRDGVCLSCALPVDDWEARWDWWGARTKKDNDVVAYLPSPTDRSPPHDHNA